MNWRLLSAIVAVVFPPTTAFSQQVISDDGFATIPWYSSAEEVEAVWGEPLKTDKVSQFGMRMFVYHGLPTDYPETYTVFGVDSKDRLVVGNIVAFVKDSPSAATAMSEWSERVSSARGTPICPSDESTTELPVAMTARWCGAHDLDCSCDRAPVGLIAWYFASTGYGVVALNSESEEFDALRQELPVAASTYFEMMLKTVAGHVAVLWGGKFEKIR